MERIDTKAVAPNFNDSFSHGWDVMMKNFLVLLLVVIFVGAVASPLNIATWSLDPSNAHGDWRFWHHRITDYTMMAAGTMALLSFISLAYSMFVLPVFVYGGRMMFLQGTREERPDINLLVKGFRGNYLNIVLASILKTGLIIMGFIALIIPGIIIACRLAFVSYLVMDKKMDPVAAVETSWKMTKGHGWTIFFMALASFFICIAGLIILFIGIFPALIWIESSFATLYGSVLNKKGIV